MKSPCPELEWVITNTACESCVCVRVYMCCKHLIANVCVCVYVCMCVFVLYVLLFSFIFVGEDIVAAAVGELKVVLRDRGVVVVAGEDTNHRTVEPT
jgi:hypothetical protein